MRRALRALGWWVRDYAYATAWQVRAFVDRTDPSGYLHGDAVPLLVIPGVYESWQFMRPLIEAASARGHPVHIVSRLGRNRRPVIEMAQLVTEYLDAHGLSDVVVVAHSKGGLVGKQAMLGAAAARIRGMVAIATPFGGSRYARLMLAPTLRLFSPGDATIVALGRQREANARIVSIYARFDPHIPEGSELAGAKNVELDTGGHFRVLAMPAVRAELFAFAGLSSR